MLFSLVSATVMGQMSKAEAIKIEKEVADMAKDLGDPSVVKSTFYRLVALEGENSTYKDSLAYIYFSGRQYGSSFLLADQVLKRSPDHEEMLQIKAVSLESLGAYDKAAEVYATLIEKTQSNIHGYNLAKLQFSMKKNEEAYATIQKVEGMNDTGNYKVNFAVNQNHTEQIELLAAIPYLKGLIEAEMGKTAEAKVSIEKALTVQPDFTIARDKLESLNN